MIIFKMVGRANFVDNRCAKDRSQRDLDIFTTHMILGGYRSVRCFLERTGH